MIVDGLGSSEAGGQLSHVSVGAERDDRHVRDRARQPRAVGRPRPRARARRRRARLAGQERPAGARLPRRRGEDGAHVSRGRRRALRRARRPGPAARRRRRRAARPRRGDDQLRRREDLRRGGRGGASRRTRPCTTAWSPDGRASAGATRSSPSSGCRAGYEVDDADAARRRPSATSPATSCRRRFVFVDEVARSPTGKADYRWAKQVAAPAVGMSLRRRDQDRPVDGTLDAGRANSLRRSKRAWDTETLPRATTRSPRCGRCSTPSHRGTTW